ncbi:hypothetical protein B0H16DRAFT_1459255 [Mycena metata]|uniref:Uncharacterized protein n=1 Tax=Mycena metata TaxID=1033252 RepID=A0AAD7NCB3_9AGAR|nr:hypothetical protein B0H16DRAFT_1459255 [Mycena metata]
MAARRVGVPNASYFLPPPSPLPFFLANVLPLHYPSCYLNPIHHGSAPQSCPIPARTTRNTQLFEFQSVLFPAYFLATQVPPERSHWSLEYLPALSQTRANDHKTFGPKFNRSQVSHRSPDPQESNVHHLDRRHNPGVLSYTGASNPTLLLPRVHQSRWIPRIRPLFFRYPCHRIYVLVLLTGLYFPLPGNKFSRPDSRALPLSRKLWYCCGILNPFRAPYPCCLDVVFAMIWAGARVCLFDSTKALEDLLLARFVLPPHVVCLVGLAQYIRVRGWIGAADEHGFGVLVVDSMRNGGADLDSSRQHWAEEWRIGAEVGKCKKKSDDKILAGSAIFRPSLPLFGKADCGIPRQTRPDGILTGVER